MARRTLRQREAVLGRQISPYRIDGKIWGLESFHRTKKAARAAAARVRASGRMNARVIKGRAPRARGKGPIEWRVVSRRR